MSNSDETKTCKGITKKGFPCQNRPMNGFDYCSKHQPTCSYQGPNGETCRNFVTGDGEMCTFHASSDELDSTALPQQTSLLVFVGSEPVSRREFITGGWTSKYLRKITSSIASLPRPIKVVGEVVGVAIAEYLITGLLDYFKETHNIEYFIPPSFTREPEAQGEGKAGEVIGDREAVVRVINRSEKEAQGVITYADYNTHQTYQSPSFQLAPSQSYVDLPMSVPDGFFGGVMVSSNTELEGRPIVRLRIDNDKLDVHNSQFLRFTIPWSQNVPLEIHNVIAMAAFGRQDKLERVSDIPCTVIDDRIYFDRGSIFDLIEVTDATEGVFLIQLEGLFLVSDRIHELASEHLPGYSVDKAELRFETTTEILPVLV